MRFRFAILTAIVVTAALVAVSSPVPLGAQAASQGPAVTFTKDVAPILQRSCQKCHRPGSIAPMSFLSYEDVRPWARTIKTQVTKREMPPWYIDRTVGVRKFDNDPSLSDAEISTIARWVDGGAVRGNPADMPPPVQFQNTDIWQIGKPDLIVKSKAHVVPATGSDWWGDYTVDTGLTEDRYLKAVETKPSPGAKQVVHHAVTFLIQEGDDDDPALIGAGGGAGLGGLLNEYAV